jgi:hypothetical protein
MPQQFGAFTASELYCPKCKRAQPVREKLLLVLPHGELYEYLCTGCGGSLGQRTVSGPALATGSAVNRPAARARRAVHRPPGRQPAPPRGLLR